MPLDSKTARALAGLRKNPKGGRPTKKQKEIEKLAAELLMRALEERLRTVVDVYWALATGAKVPGKRKVKLDPATTRHYIERFAAPAARTLNLNVQKSVEDFYDEVEKRMAGGAVEEEDEDTPKDPEGLH